MPGAGSPAVEEFLAMLAAERGAAANTLAAYRRDLAGAAECVGDPALADAAALTKLAAAWAALAPSSVARKASVLRVHAIHEDVRFTRPIARAVRAELDDLAAWLGLERVDLAAVT